ncbi:MAG: hypothetical protein LUF25_04535 [Phascolarctobacterium sp.]|nr:hypothetical protein [Phascolarctobacterium sp.]
MKALTAKYQDCREIDPEDGPIAECLTGYTVTLENDSISDVPVTLPVEYVFANNKLMKVSVNLNGDSNEAATEKAVKMRSALRTLYGACTKSLFTCTSNTFIWQWRVTRISFTVLYKIHNKTDVQESVLRLESEKMSAYYVKYLKEHQ